MQHWKDPGGVTEIRRWTDPRSNDPGRVVGDRELRDLKVALLGLAFGQYSGASSASYIPLPIAVLLLSTFHVMIVLVAVLDFDLYDLGHRNSFGKPKNS